MSILKTYAKKGAKIVRLDSLLHCLKLVLDFADHASMQGRIVE